MNKGILKDPNLKISMKKSKKGKFKFKVSGIDLDKYKKPKRKPKAYITSHTPKHGKNTLTTSHKPV